MNISPVKPIDINQCQEECANTFGFDFDIKFCKMPQSIYEEKKVTNLKRRKIEHEKPDLEPKFTNCLGLSNFTAQFVTNNREQEDQLIEGNEE